MLFSQQEHGPWTNIRPLVTAQAMNTEDQTRPSEAAWTTHIDMAPGGMAGHLDQDGSWWQHYINTDPGCRKTTDPDMALSSSTAHRH